MAATYRMTAPRRLVNAVFKFLIGAGLAPAQSCILSVPGRRTGREYRTPVNLVLRDGARFLVSPYGERAWTVNARAAGSVTLRRGGTVETVTLHELDATEAAPVLRQYAWENAITRPFFDATPESPESAFAAEAARHPVFRLGPPRG
jgi:deazaflavin-dependent oxidoreductase (nitroreductase family)